MNFIKVGSSVGCDLSMAKYNSVISEYQAKNELFIY